MAKKNIKNKGNVIPVRNYVILGIIIIVTLLGTMYLCAWFRSYNESKITNPIITSTIREVEYNNLDTVLLERDVLIMYMCTTDDSVCRSFEKKFSKYIKDNNLSEEIVYLNLGYQKDETSLLDKVYDNYKSADLVKKVYDYPALVIFNQGKIIDVLSSSDKELTIEHVEEFLEGYEL